jgi:hypothetical protein
MRRERAEGLDLGRLALDLSVILAPEVKRERDGVV